MTQPTACPTCRDAIQPNANFCPNCGHAIKGPVDAQGTGHPLHWEYRDAVIPLNFPVANLILDGTSSIDKDARHFNPIVLDYLNREGQNGWHADEPTDIPSLYRARRIQVRGLLRQHYVSVTIRLRRLVV